MERTADERREILRAFIKDGGFKIARWAKDSGVDKNSIYNFLNGHSNALDPPHLREARQDCRRPGLAHQRGHSGTTFAYVDLGMWLGRSGGLPRGCRVGSFPLVCSGRSCA
jgi:hypothetical protein